MLEKKGQHYRKYMLTGLVLCFGVQSFLVYTDDTGRKREPLDPLAQKGRVVWQKNNCQSCHQIHGFGGYLGPDLTNAVPGISREVLEAFLRTGPKQMPSFELSNEDVSALHAYLASIAETGTAVAILNRAQAHSIENLITNIPWFEFE